MSTTVSYYACQACGEKIASHGMCAQCGRAWFIGRLEERERIVLFLRSCLDIPVEASVKRYVAMLADTLLGTTESELGTLKNSELMDAFRAVLAQLRSGSDDV